MRPVALGRKNWLHVGSAKAGPKVAAIISIVESCRRLGVPVLSKSKEEAADYFGWFTHFAMIDNRASSEKTRQVLGWQPTQPGLLADIDQPAYFQV